MSAPRKPARNLVRKRRLRRYAIVAKLVVAFVCVGGMAYALGHYMAESPRFHAKHVRIEGLCLLDEVQVIEAAGITRAANVLFLDLAAVCERVEAIPMVSSATAQRAYPDMVSIRIEERVPVASLLHHNHAYEIDAAARVLREVAPLQPSAGPLITNIPDLEAVQPGEQLEDGRVLAALELWGHISREPALQGYSLSEIAVPSRDHLGTHFDELPFEVRWGRSDFGVQAMRFGVLLAQEGGELPCREYLDLRFDEDLVCQ